MALQTIKSDGVLRFTFGCVIVSILTAISFVLWGYIPDIRGPSAGVGVMAALIGSGVALWFSARGRDSRLFMLAVLSLFSLAFWCWAIYESVYK
jgi:hypothetical protein